MDAYRLYRMLERRYDGELPQHLRRAALAGGARSFDAAALHADARCWDRQALIAQTKAAAQRADTTTKVREATRSARAVRRTFICSSVLREQDGV